MRRMWSAAIGAAVVATVVVPGVGNAAPSSSVRWGECPADVAKPGLECSTLQVPLDYRRPDGRTIEIAISRLASKNPAQRRGVLLTNPGGPGGGGLDYPFILAYGMSQTVLDAYDVIGFDPRGVAHSTPVTCDLTEEQLSAGSLPVYADTPAEVVAQIEPSKALAEQCAAAETADLLPYVTTANTARDLDRIRVALGEETISYDGGSYGTYLGAVYTTLFPERSDRIVLDSALGPGGYDVTAMRRFARGLEERFPDFAAFAAAAPEYGLGTTPAEVSATYFELAARLDEAPVQGVNGTAFRWITHGGLYSDYGFANLAANWQALLADQPLPPSPIPLPPNPENAVASRYTVTCGDSRWPTSVLSYQVDVAVDRIRYPMLGGSSANIGPCAFWPDPVEPPVRIGGSTGSGPRNVLVVQNLRDPGTPLVGARELRRAFGDRARLVTADQGGHGVYPFGANQCANDAVTTFLTTGQQPPRDLACAAETR